MISFFVFLPFQRIGLCRSHCDHKEMTKLFQVCHHTQTKSYVFKIGYRATPPSNQILCLLYCCLCWTLVLFLRADQCGSASYRHVLVKLQNKIVFCVFVMSYCVFFVLLYLVCVGQGCTSVECVGQPKWIGAPFLTPAALVFCAAEAFHLQKKF